MKKSAPSWSISGRQSAPKEASVPGPGAYTPSKSDKPTAYPLSRSERSGIVTPSSVPGPGSYEPKASSAQKSAAKAV